MNDTQRQIEALKTMRELGVTADQATKGLNNLQRALSVSGKGFEKQGSRSWVVRTWRTRVN